MGIDIAGIGGALPPKKPLNRFVKWPKYVRIQRQKRVLCQRLKVPPALNQFTKALDKNSGTCSLVHVLRLPSLHCSARQPHFRWPVWVNSEAVNWPWIGGGVWGEDPHTSLLFVGDAASLPRGKTCSHPGLAAEACTQSRVLRVAVGTGSMVATATRTVLCLCLAWRGDLTRETGWLRTTAANLFKLLMKYRPEDKAEKKERLMAKAVAEKDGKTLESKKPICVKFGLNHVTYLIEQVRLSHPHTAPAQ
jgi:hypothetical protein